MEGSGRGCCGTLAPRGAFLAVFVAATIPTWIYVAVADLCGCLGSLCTTRSEEDRLRAARAHGGFVGRAISKSWQLAMSACCWLRIDASGLQPLEDAGRGERPVFMIANHVSFFDTPLICANVPQRLVGDMKTLMARRFLGFPLIGRVARAIGHLPVPFSSATRGDHTVDKARLAEILLQVDRHIDSGGHLAIFPEGDLNRQWRTLLPFRAGGLEISIRHDMEVWGWLATGTADSWPEGYALGGLPATMRLRAVLLHQSAKDAAVRLAGPDAPLREQALALAEDLRASMQSALDEMLAEEEASSSSAAASGRPGAGDSLQASEVEQRAVGPDGARRRVPAQ